MKIALKTLGLAGLAMTLVPPLLFLAGALGLSPMKHVMIAGCILWFATAPAFLKGGEE